MRRSLFAAAALVAFLAVGCAFGGDDEVPRSQLGALVLKPDDLPAVWQQFDEGRQTNADSRPWDAEGPARFGRVGGWKARYRRSGTPTTRGALVIESRADLFESRDGAQKDLASLADAIGRAEGLPRMPVDAPQIGDASVAATLMEPREPNAVRYYLVAWRDRNVTASILVNGFEGRIRLEDALRLARKQQQRIEAAG